MYNSSIEITYFDSFGVEHVPKEILKIIGKTNVFRIQANKSIMRRYLSIEFIDFMLANKTLIG